jgi:hypothetical protein
MQKVYMALRAFPWEKLTVQDGPPNPDGTKKVVTAHGDFLNAGFLPVYWTEEAAKAANPDTEIKEAGVGDEWAKRPNPPGNVNTPQGDQFDFIGLEGKDLVAKVKETEEILKAKGMESVGDAIRGFVLGKASKKKIPDEKLRSYLMALHKVLDTKPG